ncbi:hypothetical protein [Chitinophaga sp. CB10]|uniref:hypothetical protein n=1 Tax=Chitinophaga sp. CB10 TaxID=1891659 RepID=UPI0025C2B2C9|nr:hypothetical protein [Chitinophaga sp. CB10]
MNKAKFLLSAIGVLAVAASALATKAKLHTILYTRSTDATTLCEVTITNVTLDPLQGNFSTVTFATAQKSATCTTPVSIYSNE